MSAILTIPSKQSPFPYAAAAIAAYSGKHEININDSATTINLDIDGTSINEEETIVQVLAKEMGLSEDSEKAKIPVIIVPQLFYSYYFRPQGFLPSQKHCEPSLFSRK